MDIIYGVLIVLSAVPSVYWCVQMAREPGEKRCLGGAVGILLLGLVAAAALLLLSGFDSLV